MPTSVAVLDVSLATYSRFTQTPNYIDSDAPPVKFQFCCALTSSSSFEGLRTILDSIRKLPFTGGERRLAATPKGYRFVSDNCQVDQ
jgi:hypothetical protein